MTSDPHDSHREDQDQPAEPEPADEPEDEPAHRPGVADALATLAAYRAILNGASPAGTHDNAAGGSCPACATVAAAGFGIMVAEKLAAGLVRKLALGGSMIPPRCSTLIARRRGRAARGRRTSPAASCGLTMAAIATPRWRHGPSSCTSWPGRPARPAPMRRPAPACPKEARAMTTPTAAPGPGVHTGSFGGYPFPAEVVARIIDLLISGAVFAPSLTRQGTVRSTVAWPTAKPTGWAWLEELQPFPDHRR